MTSILLLISISHGSVEARACVSIFDKMLVKVSQAVEVRRMLQLCFILITTNNLAKNIFLFAKIKFFATSIII